MSTEIKVPNLPESVSDALLAAWHKKVGDYVKEGENLVDLETDKVVLEVPTTKSGVLKEILIEAGTTVTAGQILAVIDENAAAASEPANDTKKAELIKESPSESKVANSELLSPAAKRLVEEKKLNPADIKGSGKDGRITKEDIINFLEKNQHIPIQNNASSTTPNNNNVATPTLPLEGRIEQRVPMSRLRAKIAERLLEAKNSTAMLTTFNEVNMQPVMDLRNKYKEQFEKTHGVRLGFMSFFVKAAIEALKKYPGVNASLEGNDIIYHGYFDIGVAVSSPRGLVVPILRNADQMTMAEIEAKIVELATKAKDGSLTIEEMTGGTFTITNGGVFGSLMSTPIINPPQSGILGMHKTMDRPIAENGQVVIRPMMYIAHSYDHRIIDGREAVGLLVTIKECLEDPARILLNL